MKREIIIVIVAVGLSLFATWLLMPSMFKYWTAYYMKKNPPVESAEVPTDCEEIEEATISEVAPEEAITIEGIRYPQYGIGKISVQLHNNIDKPIESVLLRFIRYDKSGNQVDYTDLSASVHIDPGMSKEGEFLILKDTYNKSNTKVQVIKYYTE